MSRTSILWLPAIALTFAAAACGDDDDDGGGSGVPGGTRLDALTSAQAQDLCRFSEELNNSSSLSEVQYCTYFYSLPEDAGDACELTVEQCLEEDWIKEDLQGDLNCEQAEASDLIGSATCTATVSDFEACLKAVKTAYERAARAASCDDPDSLEDIDYPESCETLFEKCPEIDI